MVRSSLLLTLPLALMLVCAPAFGSTIFLQANLSGAGEIPPVSTSGSGIGEVDLSDNGSSGYDMHVILFLSGLSGNVLAAGIYLGDPFTANDPTNPSDRLLFGLNVPFPSFTSGTITGDFFLAYLDERFGLLLEQSTFFNVFTDQACPGGFCVSSDLHTASLYQEVRGEIVGAAGPVLGVPEPATLGMLGLGLGVGALAWRRRRRG